MRPRTRIKINALSAAIKTPQQNLTKAPKVKPKAVLLNDTRADNHFGCFRVMRIIEENLERRGIEVIARSPVRHDWEKDRNFLANMADCDLIIINGEGTLHHGTRHGEKLLKVVEHPARRSKPVALINAIYQENPKHWSKYLEKMALISTRDTRSARLISAEIGKPIRFVPDLSLSEKITESRTPTSQKKILIGDSVSRETTNALYDIIKKYPNGYILPITKNIKPSKNNLTPALRYFREIYIKIHSIYFAEKHKRVIFNNNETGFYKSLLEADIHVTGRFHAICFCLLTKTPFLTVNSNSWKIESLLEDLGIGTSRIVNTEALRSQPLTSTNYAFSDSELAAIDKGLKFCSSSATSLFNDIAAVIDVRRTDVR